MWFRIHEPLSYSAPVPRLGDYLGGEAYWAGGLHVYTPLPFRPGQGGFGELFRTHFFLNAGNLCNLNYGKARAAPTPSGALGLVFPARRPSSCPLVR